MSTPHIAIVVLAAGSSRRLGHPKQLVPFRGTPLVAHAARTALDAGLGPVVVVLGAHAETVAPALAGLDARIVTNRAWADGVGRSIAAGVDAAGLDPACEAVILMTCDQPGVSAEHLRRLAATWHATAAGTVGSAYGGTTGIPALFARSTFASLMELTPSAGARTLLISGPAVPCDACEQDVDTPSELPPP